MDTKVLYQDRDLAVCLKNPGIVSEDGGMPQMLSSLLGGEFFCIHRLDKAVGGVMVYARNARSAADLSRMTSERRMKKEYLAVIPDVLREDSAVMKDLLFRDRAKNKSYVVKRMRNGVKEASLQYQILSRKDGLALVKILLHTGRSHQIRCQFASRGAAILGDGRYGSSQRSENIALWSFSLSFTHPVGKKPMSFSAAPSGPLWEKFEDCIASLI